MIKINFFFKIYIFKKKTEIMNEYYFFYLKLDDDESIIRLHYEYQWEIKFIKGNEEMSEYLDFDYKYDIDDILEYLGYEFDIVNEIDESEIDDFTF